MTSKSRNPHDRLRYLEGQKLLAQKAMERAESEARRLRECKLRESAHLDLALALYQLRDHHGDTWESLSSRLANVSTGEALRKYASLKAFASVRHFMKLREATIQAFKDSGLVPPVIGTFYGVDF